MAQFVHNFPPIWQPATLLPGDTAGQALWAKISGNIPNIPPKGQLNGSTINVTYDSVNDPDCCKWHVSPLFDMALGAAGDRQWIWVQVTGYKVAAWTSLSAILVLYFSRFAKETRDLPFYITLTGWSITRCTTPKQTGLPADVSSVPEPRTMGYGFDDGPNCTHNVFYDFLASQNQKATMFYIGSNVMNWPLEAQRALADGHQICARKRSRCV